MSRLVNQTLENAMKLLKSNKYLGKFQVVMGNESADLDSMVSSVLFAFHLSRRSQVPVIPLFNIPREDFELRLDAKYLFERVGIDVGNIAHLEDLDDDRWNRVEGVRLVDHNVLADRQESIRDKVVEVIDHHENMHLFSDGVVPQVIELVGSCTSLVLERLEREQCEIIEDSGIAELALAVILLDTSNLNRGKKKFDELDVNWANRLTQIANLGEFSGNSLQEKRDSFYEILLRMRTDVSLLSSAQLLRKDLKFCSYGSFKLGISAIPISLSDWKKNDPNLGKSLSEFSDKFDLALAVVMTAFSDPTTKAFSRELLLFSRDTQAKFFRDFESRILRDHASDNLNDSSLKLVRIQIIDESHLISTFQQNNVLASRKQVMPLVLSLIAKL
jgi:exopolyphosphatase